MSPPARTVDAATERRLRIARRVMFAALGVAIVATVAFGVIVVRAYLAESQPEPETYGELPAFSFTDHTGEAFTEEKLRDRVTIANFIFTRCDTVCPVFSMKMQRLQETTGDWDAPPRLVSFSVDPEHDTPPVLAAFAGKFGADPARWRFVTGDPADIRRVVRDNMAVAMEREGVTEDGVPDIVHGEHFVLIDGDLRIRGYYNSNDPERIDELKRDARWLASR